MNLFIEKLYQSFLQNSGNDCFSIEDNTYTYFEILQIANQIRHQIQHEKSQNIGIYLTDDVYMYSSILAVWFEGKTYVPLHPDFPLNKNINVIQQADIDIILSSVEIKANFEANIIDTRKNVEINTTFAPKEFSIENNAYILFTSGSTGNPKGVPIRFSNLYYFSESFDSTFGNLNSNDTVLQMFELTFDLSVMSYLIPWLNGAKVIGLHKKETKFLQILDLLETNKITVALMVPSILNLIIPYLDPSIKNESLRLNLFCGEALLTKQIEGWKDFVPNSDIYNVYGPTENTIFCTQYKIEHPIKDKKGIISIGKSIKNSEMSFIDNNNEGELLLSGKLLTNSYWKNEEKTQEAFILKGNQKYYKTGDWCLRDKDGDYFYINRIDFQAKINGFRVELAEIEYFANEKLDNAISIAVIHKDINGNDILVLFINDTKSNENTILEYLKLNLPDYCIPSKIIKLESFPVNTSGKIDRKELKNTL